MEVISAMDIILATGRERDDDVDKTNAVAAVGRMVKGGETVVVVWVMSFIWVMIEDVMIEGVMIEGVIVGWVKIILSVFVIFGVASGLTKNSWN